MTHTHSPVDLDLVFDSLRLPTRQRLSIIVNELGTGLVGRPRELNAVIRRANPALQQANRALAILDSERGTLGRLIDASDRVIGELANRHQAVADFIVHASHVSRTFASRRGDLDLAVHRLPPLLAELQPAARDLTGLATDARPVVRNLGRAAPQVRALLGDFGPLTRAARPTLVKLDELSRVGLRTVRVSRPVAKLLDAVTQRLPETVRTALPLVRSLRDRKVIEQIAAFAYGGAVSTSRFDKVSHILPSYQISGGKCQQFAQQPVAGCDAHFQGSGKSDPTPHAARRDATVASEGLAPTGARGHLRRRHRRRSKREHDIAKRAARHAVHPLVPVPLPQNLPSHLLDFLLKP